MSKCLYYSYWCMNCNLEGRNRNRSKLLIDPKWIVDLCMMCNILKDLLLRKDCSLWQLRNWLKLKDMLSWWKYRCSYGVNKPFVSVAISSFQIAIHAPVASIQTLWHVPNAWQDIIWRLHQLEPQVQELISPPFVIKDAQQSHSVPLIQRLTIVVYALNVLQDIY